MVWSIQIWNSLYQGRAEYDSQGRIRFYGVSTLDFCPHANLGDTIFCISTQRFHAIMHNIDLPQLTKSLPMPEHSHVLSHLPTLAPFVNKLRRGAYSTFTFGNLAWKVQSYLCHLDV